MKPRNPYVPAARRRKAGAHSGKMRPDETVRDIIEEWSPLLRRLADNSGPAGDVCPDCQFEARNGHSPVCSGEEER